MTQDDLRSSAASSVADLQDELGNVGYLADRGLATAIHLAVSLHRPLLLEGEPGVGKTEVAKVLAQLRGAQLIRLQCYEGIDAGQALYEWDYARQLLYMRTMGDDHVDELFGPRFLLERPLLAAIRAGGRCVLLIDEIDRADDEFEAFLLELLSDFQVTIPEIGTIRAVEKPIVILTSNRTRELHGALKRRCLYHWIDYPGRDREVAILRSRAPEVSDRLARQVVAAVSEVRDLDVMKPPGVAETIDWARALAFMGVDTLHLDEARDTLGSLVKDREDLQVVERALAAVLGESS